jgi:UDP-2,4-diacetamido-2,4,6-trideoxy-beta-L-altropyranose hydrolase
MTVSPRPRVLFLADGGPSVGGGHVMRCLTLAGALERAGADCGFAATPEAAAVLDAFAGPTIARLRVAAAAPADLVSAAIEQARAWGATAAVLDHYGTDVAQEAALRAAASRLLVMDDLLRPHDADLVLDSSLGRSVDDYPGAAVLAGLAFALVRPEFAAARAAALARRGAGGGVRRILVSLGLTDVGGITGRVVRALLSGLGERMLDVVVGAAAPSLPELRALAAVDARMRLHVDTREMAALIAGADLAVGAGGSSAWERCCLGLPTVTVVLADNQRANTEALETAGATTMVELAGADFERRLAAAVEMLCSDTAVLAAMSAAAAGLCDGRGAERAAERLLALVRG